MEIAILGLGCFWGPERKFGEINGVTNTEVGYCGGKNKDTNYQEVCTGTTGHAEVVKIEFDENIISYFECFYYLSTWSITTKFHCKINISHYDKSFEKLKKSSTSLGKNILTDLSEKLIIILTS